MKLTILILFALTYSGLLKAANYYVNDNSTIADVYTSAVGNNGNPGSASLPFATLDYAVSTVGLIAGDTVFIDVGYFYQTDANLNLNVSNIAIIGAGSSLTTFDNDQGSIDANKWANITANDITIQGIKITGYNYGFGGASALNISGAIGIQIIDVLADENKPGGGASSIVVSGGSQVDFLYGGSNCNTALSVAGGGVNVEGNGNLVSFSHYSFSNNSKDWQGGSGLYISGDNTTTVTVISSIFADNRNGSSTGGSAIYLAGSNLFIDSSCFSNNTYSYSGGPAYGGAISVGRGASLALTNCTFSGNSCSSSGKGGAIAINTSFSGSGSASVVNIDTCSFSSNSASSEGNDLYARVGSGNPATFNINECSFSGTALDIREDNTASVNIQNSGTPSATGAGINVINTTSMTAMVATNCPIQVGSCYTIVCTPPLALTLSATPNPICEGDSSVISISGTQTGISYQLRDDGNDTLIGPAINGTGGTINFYTGPLASTMSYNVLATELALLTCQTELGPITITVHENPTLNPGNSTSICEGDSITLGDTPTASGGIGGYSYSWFPSLEIDDFSIANPIAFPSTDTWFFITVTSGACTNIDSVEITLSPLPIADAGISTTNLCEGDTVSVGGAPTGTGGTGTLTYTWFPNISIDNNSFSNPNIWPSNSATYFVQVQDANMCTANDTIQITVNPNPLADAGNASETICEGDTIFIGGSPAGSGGSGTLNYSWSPVFDISEDTVANPNVFPNSNTTYILTVSDLNNCEATDSVVISIGTNPLADAGNAIGTLCEGDTISIGGSPSGAGGTGSLTFSWAPNSDISNDGIANPAVYPSVTTDYILSVTDSLGCQMQDTVTIPVSSSPIALATSSSNRMCFGDSILLSASGSSGGTGALNYLWQPNTFLSDSINIDVDASPSSTTMYVLTVTDSNLCSQNDSILITVNALPSIDISAAVSAPDTCGQTLGNITGVVISSSGGSLIYDWSDGVTSVGSSLDLFNVPPGNYSLHVTDSLGCSSGAGPFSVLEVVGPSIDVSGIILALDTCGVGNGSITGATVSGGTMPYFFSWNDGSSIIDSVINLTGVSSGSYTLLVTDSLGCSALAGPFLISTINGPVLDSSLLSVSDANCGQSDGFITGIVAVGGTGSTSYSWSNGSTIVGTLPDLSGVPSGTYILTISDSAGCISTSSPITLGDLNGPLVDSGSVMIDLSSCGGSDGNVIGLLVSGGTLPYTYAWDDGVSTVGTDLNLLNVGLGNYSFVVTDSNGCSSGSGPYIISEFGAPIIDASLINTISETCDSANGSISGIAITGGTAPFTFEWSDGTSIIDSFLIPTNLIDGNYFLTIIDSNNCSATYGPVTIENIPGPIIDSTGLISSNSTCNLPNGSISGLVVTPVSILDLSWNNGDTTLSISNLSAGTYTLVVTDTNGCETVASISIGSLAIGLVDGVDDYESTLINTPITIVSSTNDIGDFSTISILTGPTNGTVIDNGSGNMQYFPSTNFVGTDIIIYTICDSLCADICDTATIYITIEEEVILNIPNGFSPNGDGINDAFYIEGLENYPNNDIIIFNRWGDEVFSAQPYDNNWEGRTTNNTLKISGDVVVDGTYYFVLNLNQVGENPKNGFIELRRN